MIVGKKEYITQTGTERLYTYKVEWMGLCLEDIKVGE